MGELLDQSPQETEIQPEPVQPEIEPEPMPTGDEKTKSEEDGEEQKRQETERKKQDEEKKIAEEKKKIIAEMIEQIKNIFAELNPQDIQSVLLNGRRSNGNNLEAGSLGELRPEQAQNFAVRYQEGRLTPDVMNNFPDILQRLDEWLTNEAKRRIKEKENEGLQNEEVPETKEPVKEEERQETKEVTKNVVKSQTSVPEGTQVAAEKNQIQ